MDATFTAACPECEKRLKVPAELAGKKVRCKDCGHTFVVKAPVTPPKKTEPKKPAEAKKAAAPAAKAPAAGAKKAQDDGEYDNPNPYDMSTIDLTPRCPHCAAELESADTVLCIGCGYNLETREHLRTVKAIETSGQDQFLWLLPGIACVVGILLLIGLDLFWLFVLPELAEDDEIMWLLTTAPITLWIVICSLFGMFFCGKFAIKRLILNPTAPEQEK